MALPNIKNMVGMTVTSVADSGLGLITLNAAVSGYQSCATAYGADANVDIRIKEGSAWEIARNCTYTNSGTTVNRGTLEASSTGSAVAFTSAAEVYVTNAASRIAKAYQGYLEPKAHTLTTAGITGEVGTLHVLTIAGLTDHRAFTLPAVCAVGDRVALCVVDGDDTYSVPLMPATGDTINAGTASAEWSRLFIAGEIVVFRCVTADSAWIVENDGRIHMVAHMSLTTAATTSAANTYVFASANSGVWTVDHDNASLATAATDKITIRRACKGIASVGLRTNSTLADGKYVNAAIEVNGSGFILNQFFTSSTAGLSGQIAGAIDDYFATGDYIRHTFRTEEANKGASAINANFLGFSEIL